MGARTPFYLYFAIVMVLMLANFLGSSYVKSKCTFTVKLSYVPRNHLKSNQYSLRVFRIPHHGHTRPDIKKLTVFYRQALISKTRGHNLTFSNVPCPDGKEAYFIRAIFTFGFPSAAPRSCVLKSVVNNTWNGEVYEFSSKESLHAPICGSRKLLIADMH